MLSPIISRAFSLILSFLRGILIKFRDPLIPLILLWIKWRNHFPETFKTNILNYMTNFNCKCQCATQACGNEERCDCYCHHNPFYDNHLFTKKDLKRFYFNKWSWIWLWLFPTFVQINDGYAFHYKIVNGAYYFIKFESLFKYE